MRKVSALWNGQDADFTLRFELLFCWVVSRCQWSSEVVSMEQKTAMNSAVSKDSCLLPVIEKGKELLVISGVVLLVFAKCGVALLKECAGLFPRLSKSPSVFPVFFFSRFPQWSCVWRRIILCCFGKNRKADWRYVQWSSLELFSVVDESSAWRQRNAVCQEQYHICFQHNCCFYS